MAELADAIVQCGRTTLEWTISHINHHPRWKAEVVYGDTDSVFVHLRGRSREEAFAIGEEIANEITKQSPADVVLKFEKVYLPCALVSKKRYVGYAFENLRDMQPRFDAKGIEVVRRDQCVATCKLQEKCLRILFDTKDLSAVKSYLYEQWTKMHQGGTRLPLKDFIFRKEVRLGKYANNMSSGDSKSLPPGAIVACKDMARDPRAEPPYRWRVPYVVVAGPPQAILRDLVMSPEEVLMRSSHRASERSSGDSMIRINHIYYITKHIIPALDRVLNFSGIDVGEWYRNMPKPSATLKRNSPLAPSILRCVLGADISCEEHDSLAWRGKIFQPTITQFMQEERCMTCGKELDKNVTSKLRKKVPKKMAGSSNIKNIFTDALCSTCAASPGDVLAMLLTRLQTLEHKHQALRTMCGACAGHSQIEDLFLPYRQSSSSLGHHSLLGADCCQSIDCPVLHERRRGLSKLEDAKVAASMAASVTVKVYPTNVILDR